MDSVLAYIDIDHIQEYIFGSNDLAQNIGASELVRRATSDDESGWLHELRKRDDCCVIYAGGGNAAILFNSSDAAKREIRALTYKALTEARGLQFAVHTWPTQPTQTWHYDPAANDLKQRLDDLRKQSRERQRHTSLPQLGLGVTATCPYTSWPVAGTVGSRRTEQEAVSKVVLDKRAATELGNARLRQFLPDASQYAFVSDFDDFGTAGESSYIAVIHADGNGMAKRFGAIVGNDNEDYIAKLQAFSKSINAATDMALRATLHKLLASYDTHDERKPTFAHPPIPARKRKSDKKTLLPFRPLVFGGDDVTFVADGRLGLDMAATYLHELQHTAPKLTDGRPLYSCAGVAVAHTHFPFARVYELAGELTEQAKQASKAKNDFSIVRLDWHFSTTGTIDGLSAIRAREYCADDGRSLLLRPLTLGQPEADWHSYENFRYVADTLKNGLDWEGRRNKVKALGNALRKGPEAVKHFRLSYNIDLLPGANSLAEMLSCGWADPTALQNDSASTETVDAETVEPTSSTEPRETLCGYFDAVEALDFFNTLQKSS